MKYQKELVQKLFAMIKDSEESNAAAETLNDYVNKFNVLLMHSSLNLCEIFQSYMLEEPEGINVEYYDDDTLIVKNKFDEVIIRSRSIEIK